MEIGTYLNPLIKIQSRRKYMYSMNDKHEKEEKRDLGQSRSLCPLAKCSLPKKLSELRCCCNHFRYLMEPLCLDRHRLGYDRPVDRHQIPSYPITRSKIGIRASLRCWNKVLTWTMALIAASVTVIAPSWLVLNSAYSGWARPDQ